MKLSELKNVYESRRTKIELKNIPWKKNRQ